MEYNIIYSLLAHESPECVIDLLQNINGFGQVGNTLIVLHLNDSLYMYFSDFLHNNRKIFPNVFINPTHWNKRYFSSDFLKAHIENYEYIHNLSIKFKHFVWLASNCLFCRKLTQDVLDGEVVIKLPYEYPKPEKTRVLDIDTYILPSEKNNWHWKKFQTNQRMNSLLAKHSIHYIAGSQHEGAIHTPESMDMMSKLKSDGLFSMVDEEVPFEEIIPSSVYLSIHKEYVPYVCKVFWGGSYYPTIDQMIESEYPCVKWIPRVYDNPLRVWIRQKLLEATQKIPEVPSP